MSCFKALFICQATFLVLAKAQNEQQQAFPHEACPQYDDAAHPVQLTYPYDCSKYYSCLRGLAYLHSCPIGLHWSSLTYRCDYPAVAKCQPLVKSVPTMLPTNDSPTYYAPTLEYHPYAGDCNKYLQCQVLQWPTQLRWNSNAQRCDSPAFATCATHQPPPTSSENLQTYVPPTAATPLPYVPNNVPWSMGPILANHTEFPAYTDSPYENELDQLCSKTDAEYINYPGDCHRFIQCNGIAYVQMCPANLYWNSELLTCDRYCK